MGKVIAISNQKGGVGKTESSLELAAILTAEHNKKVIIIDFDQQLSITKNYKLDQSNTIINIFDEDCQIKEAIQHLKYFDVIPGDERMSRADHIYEDRDDIYLLADVCEVLKQVYDYIIIDNSPSRNICLNMAYVAADYVIIPVDATPDSLQGLVSVKNDIDKLKNTREKASHANILGFILISYEKSQVNDDTITTLNNFANSMNTNIFVDKTRKSVKVKEARFVNQTLYEYARFCNPSMDYKRIAKLVIERTE